MSNIVIKPRMSEKTYAISASGVYVFDVPVSANKNDVANAVSSAYNVKVSSVRIVVNKGKAKRFYRAGKFENGVRNDLKKAYVSLADGAKLPIFEAVEEQMKESDKKTDSKEVNKAPKRGIFGRAKVNKSAGTTTTVKRTQAKVGEK
jgi:large subunit ribosomal protein L23